MFGVQRINKRKKPKFTNDSDKTRSNNYNKRISHVTLARVSNVCREYTQVSPGALSAVDRYWFSCDNRYKTHTVIVWTKITCVQGGLGDTGLCRLNTYTAARTQKQRGIQTRLEVVSRVFYCHRNRVDVSSELAP